MTISEENMATVRVRWSEDDSWAHALLMLPGCAPIFAGFMQCSEETATMLGRLATLDDFGMWEARLRVDVGEEERA